MGLVDIDVVKHGTCALEAHALPEWVRGVLRNSSSADLRRIANSAARIADLLERATETIRLADTKCHGVDCAHCKWGRDPGECDVYAMEQALREWRQGVGYEGPAADAGGQHAHVTPDRWEVYNKLDGVAVGIVDSKSVFKAIGIVAEECGLDPSALDARPLPSLYCPSDYA